MFELTYIASRSKRKQKEIEDNYFVKSGTYNQIFNEELDAIYVSVPVGLHYEFGKRVLQNKKHLLLEKTFTHSYETTEELLELAKRQKKIAMEALMYQFHPLFNQVHQLLVQGEIGEVKHIEAYFGFPHLDPNDIRYNKQLGGGAILDALVYPLSLVLLLLGDRYKKYDALVNFNEKLQVDENGTVFFEFEKSTAIIKFGFGLAYRNEYQIWGTDGILKVNRGFSRPANLANSIVIEKNTKETTIEIPAADHFSNMLDVFYENIQSKNTQLDKELLARMSIIDEIYKDGYSL